MSRCIAADIGGTHARFALATRRPDGGIVLSDTAKLKVASHASLERAFQAWSETLPVGLPDRAGIAVAAPVEGRLLKLTNNPWLIATDTLAERLGLRTVTLVNDFAAVAHAVATSPADAMAHVAGPEGPLPQTGVTCIVGPGTGLGVAALLRTPAPHVLPTEGGHLDFAPLDTLEDRLLVELRGSFRRVSVERVVSGPGLATIHAALAAIEEQAVPARTDSELWTAAIDGVDTLAAAALDRWFLSLGSVCGDLVLAQGANALVLAGGLLPRIPHLMAASGFHSRFAAKGRFEARMAAIPIRRITHPEPGLLGAASACFAAEDAHDH